MKWHQLVLYAIMYNILHMCFSDKMVSLGYNQSDIVRAVEDNQCNETMATYLLLQQQYVVST